MGLRVNTNVFSLTAQRNLDTVSRSLADHAARLSSGLRIAGAADDAAGLGISEKLRVMVSSQAVAARNIQDGGSLVQTADGTLSEVSNMMVRIRELAVRAKNGTLTDEDRVLMTFEYDAIVAEMSHLIEDTQFNGISLFSETQTIGIQAGTGTDAADKIGIDLEDLSWRPTVLGIFDLDNSVMLNFVHDTIDTFQGEVNRVRSQLGASQNRLSSALSTALSARENLTSAESRIRDVDVAHETALLFKDQILQQAAVSVLSQANLQPDLALLLLGSSTGPEPAL
ncbi:MAG: flagellin [Planctomycetota bacterium]|nr:flagellin [Planctomycetota bacterium]